MFNHFINGSLSNALFRRNVRMCTYIGTARLMQLPRQVQISRNDYFLHNAGVGPRGRRCRKLTQEENAKLQS